MLDSCESTPGSRRGSRSAGTDDRLGIDKDDGERRLAKLVHRIDELQYRLYAEDRRSVLLVLQGLDASGKDGVVRRVFEGVNPMGVTVTSFKAPVGAELQHDYLWRIHGALPRRGTVGVFNRSHYEDVVAVRMLELSPEKVWRRRYEHIRAFEQMLVDEGTAVLKVFLNVSRDEQRVRLQERVDDAEKRWKFRSDDLKVREQFDDWIAAWEEAVNETSTESAPWHVVPADRNWVKATRGRGARLGHARAARPEIPRARGGHRGIRSRVVGCRDVGIAAVDPDAAVWGES